MTESNRGGRTPPLRDSARASLYEGDVSAATRYRTIVGARSLPRLLGYELVTGVFGLIPGALGLLLRRIAYRFLFADAGRGAVFGRDVRVRHGYRIHLGDAVVLDDGCLLDGRGGDGSHGIRIGDEVVVNRHVALQAKFGSIRIGDRVDIGAGTTISAPADVEIGSGVTIGGHCGIGGRSVDLAAGPPARAGSGGRNADGAGVPARRARRSGGQITIGDGCVLGGGVSVLDGVEIGEGSFVGAGITIRRSVPPRSVVLPRGHPLVVPWSTFREPSESRPEGPAVADTDRVDQRARKVVRRAIDAVNAQLPEARRISDDAEAPLLEPEGPLDSLGFVNLVVALEEAIESEFQTYVSMTPDEASPDQDGPGPYARVDTLIAHVTESISTHHEPAR